MSSEHFIPYSQIEPLLRPGMTGEELRMEIFRRLGLNPEKHRLITAGGGHLPLARALRFGVHVRSRDAFFWADGSKEPVL